MTRRACRLLFAVCAGLAAALPVAAIAEDAGGGLERRVDNLLEDAASPLAMVVVVADANGVRLVDAHGYADIKRQIPATPQTLFAIGSISKSFTSALLLQLQDEGRYDPQRPLRDYLPAFAIDSPFPPVTGASLMSHTSGLPNYLPDAASSGYVLQALRDFRPQRAPGQMYWYSNTGYQLLGMAVERIEAQPFADVLRQRMLEPLGMHAFPQLDDSLRPRLAVSYLLSPADAAYVEAPWFPYTASDGGIATDAAGMAAYLRFLLTRGQAADGRRLLSSQAFDDFVTPVLDDYAYGLHVASIEGHRVIGHPGSIAGFFSYFEVHPEAGYGIAFLGNGRLDAALLDRIIAAVGSAYGEPATRAAFYRTRTGGYRVDDAATYAGGYRGETDALEFVADKAGRLWLDAGKDGRRLALVKLGPDVYGRSDAVDGMAYVFHRDAAGRPAAVSHGVDEFVRDGETQAVRRDYAAYVGHYRNSGAEGPEYRVFVQDGQLACLAVARDVREARAEPVRLQPDAGDASLFRLASPEGAPEYFRFDAVIDSRAQRMVETGTPMYRVDTP